MTQSDKVMQASLPQNKALERFQSTILLETSVFCTLRFTQTIFSSLTLFNLAQPNKQIAPQRRCIKPTGLCKWPLGL